MKNVRIFLTFLWEHSNSKKEEKPFTRQDRKGTNAKEQNNYKPKRCNGCILPVVIAFSDVIAS